MATASPSLLPLDPPFERELLECIPALRPYARKLAGNAFAADDLIQDTLLKAIEKNGLWQRGTNLKAWLKTIMRNRFIETCRKHHPSFVEDVADVAPAATAEDETQSLTMELQETWLAIDRLAGKYRDVLTAITLEGASYQEVSDDLGIPVGTVRSRLSRARTALRVDLESDRRYPVEHRAH